MGMPTQNTSVSNDAHPANSANTATSTANVKPGLPSPSNSETSDYQRSTPSPSNGNEEQLRSLGTSSEIDWSQTTNSSDLPLLTPPSGDPSKPISGRRKSTPAFSRNLSNHAISNNLVLQQLRVALKKLPEAKSMTANLSTSLKTPEAVKRRHSADDHHLNNHQILAKKAKFQLKRPLSASVHKNGGQGKITEYLPEMKHFIAMRKEKLDRVLNLNKV